MAARSIRDELRNSTIGAWHGPESSGELDPASTHEIVLYAKEIVSKNASLGIDSRACVDKATPNLTSNLTTAFLLFPLMLISSPFAFSANGTQWIIGHILAKFNGEAIDKRTTYQSIPSTFGLFLFRPPIHALTIGLLWYFDYIINLAYFPLYFIILWVISDISLKICRFWLKLIVNVRIALIRRKTKSSDNWKDIKKEINSLIPMLDALK